MSTSSGHCFRLLQLDHIHIKFWYAVRRGINLAATAYLFISLWRPTITSSSFVFSGCRVDQTIATQLIRLKPKSHVHERRACISKQLEVFWALQSPRSTNVKESGASREETHHLSGMRFHGAPHQWWLLACHPASWAVRRYLATNLVRRILVPLSYNRWATMVVKGSSSP